MLNLHSNQVKDTLKEISVSLSRSTIKRCFHKNRYRGFTAKCKLFTLENKKARLEFERKCLKDSARFWRKTLWTDESKINLDQNDGMRKVWRRRERARDLKRTPLSIKHGGGDVMAWACVLQGYTL